MISSVLSDLFFFLEKVLPFPKHLLIATLSIVKVYSVAFLFDQNWK